MAELGHHGARSGALRAELTNPPVTWLKSHSEDGNFRLLIQQVIAIVEQRLEAVNIPSPSRSDAGRVVGSSNEDRPDIAYGLR